MRSSSASTHRSVWRAAITRRSQPALAGPARGRDDVAMTLDLERIRKDFPALDQGIAYFDGPGGTQVPTQVGEAMARTMTAGISNRGVVTAAEQRADEVVSAAREAVADLLGCDPDGVVFAQSMTQATYDVSRALAKE